MFGLIILELKTGVCPTNWSIVLQSQITEINNGQGDFLSL